MIGTSRGKEEKGYKDLRNFHNRAYLIYFIWFEAHLDENLNFSAGVVYIGGTALFGRSRFIRMHPFTIGELELYENKIDIRHLLKFGGFPEPLLKGTERFHRLWHKERIETIVKEDIRDLENVRDLGLVELLVDALPDRVGSPLSLKSPQEDLEVSHDSIRKWLSILENLFLVFRIPTYGAPKIRAVKKEKNYTFGIGRELRTKGLDLKILWPLTYSSIAII